MHNYKEEYKMRNKTMRKLVCTAMACVTALSLTACGGGNGGAGGSEEKQAKEAKETQIKDVSFPLQEEATLKVMTKAAAISTQNPEEKLIFQRIKEQTNVNIDWTCYVEDQFVDKRNLALAKKDSLPDILFNAEMNNVDLLKYAKQGVIVPVEDLIDSYMPNLQKVLTECPEYRKLITAPDGHIYSFPWIEQLGVGKEAIQAIGGMPYINQKWLDDLGLPMPETTEDLKNVLIAFRDSKPCGTENVIPMSCRVNGGNEDLGFILGAFGYGDNPDHIMVDDDGKVVYSVTDEGYKEGISWLHELQEENLIDPEAYTQDYATYTAKGKNGQYGLFFGWDQASIVSAPQDYVPLPALKGPEGIVNAVRQSGSADGGFQAGRCVLTSACVNQELAAKWIDLMYDPLQSIQNNWGTYGEEGKSNIFELKEDNTLSHLEIVGESPYDVRVQQMVAGPLAVLNSYYGKYTTCPPDALERMDNVKSYVDSMKYEMVYPNIFMSEEDATSVARYETDIKQYAEQKKADWILNGGVDEQWEDYMQKLDELGLGEYIEIKQKYLDAYLAQ